MNLLPGDIFKHENLVAAGQTTAGQFAIWACGILLLFWHETTVLMPVAFTLVLFYPGQRRAWLAIAAVGTIYKKILGRQHFELNTVPLLLQNADEIAWLTISVQTAIAIACIYLVHLAATRFDRLPGIIRQFPLMSLHLLIWIARALGTLPLLGTLSVASTLAWRLSYLFEHAARGGAKNTAFKDHLFYMLPVFGGMSPPYGKGLDYLTRHEATDSESIARSQLAGIKLLCLAVIWTMILWLMDDAIIGEAGSWSVDWLGGWTLGLPSLVDAMRPESVTSVRVAWTSIYLELVYETIDVAAIGHVIVGCLRLLGFNVFRNTYKPLLSQSIIEFWGRYHFYFKELLVQFFFYPTFLRCSWAGEKLRIFLAVFAAAFVGNMYWHLLHYSMPVVNLNFAEVWATWGTRLVYCLFLSLGIWISMLRQKRQRSTSEEASRLVIIRRIAGVLTFYAVIRIWNITEPEIGFADRFYFTASLIGL